MDESGCTKDCGRIPTSNLLLGGEQSNAFVVKEERYEAPAISTCEGWHCEDVSRQPLEHLSVDQAPTVVVKEEPEEILPTPTGESVRSEDCCGISACTLHLEGETCNTFAVKREPVNIQVSDSQDKVFNCEDSNGHRCSPELGECQQRGTRPCQEGHQCRLCAQTSSRTASSVIGHEGTHMGKRLFVCGVCQKAFTHRFYLSYHEMIHTGERPFRCKVCLQTFLQKAHLHNHERIHAEPGDDPALHSEVEGSSREDSVGRVHSQEARECPRNGILREGGKHQCRFCVYTSVKLSDVTRHERTHTGERPFACAVCHKTFKHKFHLRDHEGIHTGERRFPCKICGKKFRKKAQLLYHTWIHRDRGEAGFGDKEESSDGKCDLSPQNDGPDALEEEMRQQRNRHQCRFCSYISYKAADVTIHERIHTGEKPFTCHVCHKAFRRNTDLLRHESVHTEEGPWSCPVCRRTFAKKVGLRLHERVHTGEGPWSCPICRRTFAMKVGLRLHERVHTSEKPSECQSGRKGVCEEGPLGVS